MTSFFPFVFQEMKLNQMRQTIAQQEQKISVQEKKITSLKTGISDEQQMVATLSSSLEEVKHVETGEINCSGPKFHNGAKSSRARSISRWFHQRYSRPPVVFLSVSRLRGLQPHDDIWYVVQVDSVSETKFTVKCWAVDTSQIRSIEVSYLVIPQL